MRKRYLNNVHLGFILFLTLIICPCIADEISSTERDHIGMEPVLLTAPEDTEQLSILVHAKNMDFVRRFSEKSYQLLKSNFTRKPSNWVISFELSEIEYSDRVTHEVIPDGKIVSIPSQWTVSLKNDNQSKSYKYSCKERASYKTGKGINEGHRDSKIFNEAIRLAHYNCFSSLINQIYDDELKLKSGGERD